MQFDIQLKLMFQFKAIKTLKFKKKENLFKVRILQIVLGH